MKSSYHILISAHFSGAVNEPKVRYFEKLAQVLAKEDKSTLLVNSNRFDFDCDIDCANLRSYAAAFQHRLQSVLLKKYPNEFRAACEMEAASLAVNKRQSEQTICSYTEAFLNLARQFKVELCILWCQFKPMNILIAAILKDYGIPVIFVHTGVLPGSIAFSLNGEMAESYPCTQQDKFHRLPLTNINLANTRAYIEWVKKK